MPNLRSGTAPKAMAETSGTQTDTSSASDELSSDFENYVRRGIADIKSMCAGFEKALDFLGDRTEKLEKRMSPLEKKVKELEIATQQNTQALEKSALAENKIERFSRRNNLRVVGLPMSRQERGVEVAVAFLEKFFDMRSPRVERAHRDGRKVGDRPCHLLIRMLSYQDKHFVLSQQRKKLEQYPFYIIDDLSAMDRAEKKNCKKMCRNPLTRGSDTTSLLENGVIAAVIWLGSMTSSVQLPHKYKQHLLLMTTASSNKMMTSRYIPTKRSLRLRALAGLQRRYMLSHPKFSESEKD
nr:uncharacterized protein LOC129280673 [Lytechinus pictus]